MKTLRELQEERGTKVEQATKLVETAQQEKRDMSSDEKTQFDNLEQEIKSLDADIERAKKYEEMNADNGHARNNEDGERKELEKFSLRKALRGAVFGNVDGFEKEMADEAEKEARSAGVEINGVGIPGKIIQPTNEERAAILAGTDVSGSGAGLVNYSNLTVLGQLQSQFLGRQLGMEVVTGLQGRVPIGRKKSFSATWTAENVANTTTVGATDRHELYPHRLTALAQLSKQLINQESADSERLITDELIKAISAALMYATVNGSGSSGEPSGILNVADVDTVSIGTDGGAMTWAHAVELESKVKTDAGNAMNLNYLTNRKVRGQLKQTSVDSGSGRFVWEGKTVNGYNAYANDQVPSDLSKGTNTDNLSAMLFGNWNDAWVGQWGGMDIIVDPYSQKQSALLELQVDSFWDIFVKQPDSFAKIVDILTN